MTDWSCMEHFLLWGRTVRSSHQKIRKSLLYSRNNYKVVINLLFALDYQPRHMVLIYICIYICMYVYVSTHTCIAMYFVIHCLKSNTLPVSWAAQEC